MVKQQKSINNPWKSFWICCSNSTFILCVEVISIKRMTHWLFVHLRHWVCIILHFFRPRPLAIPSIRAHHWTWALITKIVFIGFSRTRNFGTWSGWWKNVRVSYIIETPGRCNRRVLIVVVHSWGRVATVRGTCSWPIICRNYIVIVKTLSFL